MSTPSVSRLLSWQGQQASQAGQALLARSRDLQHTGGELLAVGSRLGRAWTGQAAQAATTHTSRRAAEVDDLAEVVRSAAMALQDAGDAIAAARRTLQAALLAASAAGCTVLDDGTVLPPAAPVMPAGLTDTPRKLWQQQADDTVAAQAASAGRLTGQIRAALTAAGTADDLARAALTALQTPTISPPPTPVAMGAQGGQWMPIAPPSCPTPTPAPAPPPAKPEKDDGSFGDFGHGLLDLAGLVPVLGEPADGVNAAWYAAEGDHVNAALSGAAMVPVLGAGATAAKVGIKGAKAADEAATAAKAADEAARARKSIGPNATGGRRIPPDELQTVPSRRGTPPTGADGHKVELHHRGQRNDSPLDEMTRTEHRGAGNFRGNHPERGPSQIDRKDFKRLRDRYWADEWDSGRFGDVP